MNRLERLVHSMVADYPVLRIPVVFLYQGFFSAIPSKNYTALDILERPGYFFGFHDKQPWSYDGSKLLAHKYDTHRSLREVENSSVQVGYFNDDNLSEFISLGKTRAWNWQQGATLQWVGREQTVAYNDIVLDRCVSKIVSLKDEYIDEIPHHLSAISQSGKYGLSISFSRFGKGMSGYGYKFTKMAREREIEPESLLMIDLQSQEYKEIVSLDDVIGIDHQPSMDEAFHFFSHCQFSPDDQHFVFYHRWLHPSGHLETRMFSSDISGRKLFLFKGSDFSHIAWCTNQDVLSFAKPDDGHHGYYLFTDGKQTHKLIGEGVLDSDGHPQCSNNGRYIVTDTYPDRLRNQFLKIFNLETKTETILAKLRIPFKYRLERRCDFHPRLSRDNKKICFDSAHSGVRAICVISNPLEI